MFDFPNAPTNGQQVQGSAGQIYAWDGAKWAAQMPPGPLSVASGGTGVNNVAAAPWVETAGDRMTGPLTVSATSGWPQIIIDKTNANDANNLEGRRGGVSRWILKLGDHAVETGTGNVGSDLVAERYNDAGVFQGVPFSINRSNGLTTFTADAPTISLVPGASNYTSIMFRRNNGNADQHRWELFSSESGDLQIRTLNDGYSAGFAAMTFKRGGTGVGVAEITTDAYNFLTRHQEIKSLSGSATLVMTADVGSSVEIYGFKNLASPQGRWLMQLGDDSAETGGNAGSDFRIHRYADNGGYIGVPLSITRSDGRMDYSGPLVRFLTGYGDGFEIQSSGYPRVKHHLVGVRIWTAGPIPNATADYYIQDESAGRSGIIIAGGSGSCWNQSGTWNAISDIATKKDIEPYERGLADLVQLRPVAFKYNGEFGTTDDGEQRYGLIAQEVEPHFPEVINTLERDETEVLGVDSGRLIYAVINSLREIEGRLSALEAR